MLRFFSSGGHSSLYEQVSDECFLVTVAPLPPVRVPWPPHPDDVLILRQQACLQMKSGTKLSAVDRCLVPSTAGEHLTSHTERKDKKPAFPVFLNVVTNAVTVSSPTVTPTECSASFVLSPNSLKRSILLSFLYVSAF